MTAVRTTGVARVPVVIAWIERVAGSGVTTVIAIAADFDPGSFEVTVMTALPAAFAVITPVPLTLAMAGDRAAQVTAPVQGPVKLTEAEA
jgi:hypothetical protein